MTEGSLLSSSSLLLKFANLVQRSTRMSNEGKKLKIQLFLS